MDTFKSRGLVPLPGHTITSRTVEPIQYQHSQLGYNMMHDYPQYGYHPYFPNGPAHTKKMPGPQYALPIVQNAELKIEEDKDIVRANKEGTKKASRKLSIQGDTVSELIRNIIKENANLKQAKGAFKKMIDILEEENEIMVFNDFEL